jgi:DNA-binding transcriptional LysR family regulator
MDLRDLRFFLAVAQTRNLSRAARAARIAQPALSRLIRVLERELSVALLERHPKGVSLTPAGESFGAGAARLLADTAAALDRAVATATGRRGRVILSALRAVIAAGFPSALQESLRVDHPEIALVVRDFDPPDSWLVVSDGRADVAVSLENEHLPGLVAESLWLEPVNYAMVPRGHPLATREHVTVPELGILPLVIARGTLAQPLLDRLEGLVRRAGLRSPVLWLDGDLRAAHLAVAAGRGWTLMSRHRVAALPEGTAALPIQGFDASMRVVALWRRGDRRPVVRTVLERIYQLARALPESAVPPSPALPVPPRVGRSRRAAGTVPPGVELRHLRAIAAVAAAQSIGRAAERLGLSQPALSRQLRELEHAVGVPLLERSARGATMLPAGISLAEDAPALLATADRLLRDATRAKRGMEGRVVLGAVATGPTSALLTSAITRSAERYPEVHLLVEEMPTPLQFAALAAGEIDLGLAHAFPTLGRAKPAGIVALRLYEDRLDAALLPAEHPLAGRGQIEARELADLPFLFMDRAFHPGFYDRVFAELRRLGLEPRVDATYDGLQAVWSLTGQGKGWSLGFRSQRDRAPTGTAVVTIKKFNLPWGIELLSRVGEPSLAVQGVIEVFREARALRPRQQHARGARGKP